MPDHQSAKRTPLSNTPVGTLVGEFMEEKARELQDGKTRKVQRKRHPLTVPVLLVLCLAVWISPSLMPQREPMLPPELIERGTRLSLYLASLRIRQYQATHQRLPADLAEAVVDSTGITYATHGTAAFELSSRVRGVPMVYRSTQPDSVFLGNDRIRGIS
jgi:hypothetical protein